MQQRILQIVCWGIFSCATALNAAGAPSVDRIVVEKSRSVALTPAAEYLANKLRVALSYADTPQAGAINLGGTGFASIQSSSNLPSIPTTGAWQLLDEQSDRYVVAGDGTFSIVQAALELGDHLAWGSRPASVLRQPTFKTFGNIFDDYACGFNRTADNFDLETHIRDTARTGIQNFEVNRIFEAIPVQVKERRAWRDKYQWWCFYSPALDMFVESKLNRGTYPDSMLAGNRAEMRKTAAIARKYGMKPSVQLFEPRHWPERLYEKHPELRGQRVDLATYSGDAEYAPDVNHPLVRRHYEEMAENLVREVPDLDLIEIWTNDSCAGIAWSKRLFMGPNGPIEARKKPVAESVVSLLTSIRNGARKVNPKVRVSINLGWFIDHRTGSDPLAEPKEILKALPADFEVSCTFSINARNSRAKSMVLSSELLDWSRQQLGREIQVQLEEVSNPWKPIGPLQGIPYPETAAAMLELVKAKKTDSFILRGGLTTAAFVPNFINNEVIRSFQYDGDKFNLEGLLSDRAKSWTGTPAEAALLRKIWAAGDDIFRHYENRGTHWTSAFFISGRTLFRHLISPLVPNAYLLEYEDTAYYRPMEFHVGETDPSWFDVSYYGYGQVVPDEMMRDLVRRLDILLAKSNALLATIGEFKGEKGEAVRDLAARFLVFRHMTATDRALFAHQVAIHAYLKAKPADRPALRSKIREVELGELENVRGFVKALDAHHKVIIPETSGEDNVYVIRAPLTHQLKQKLRVMAKHLDDEPGPVIDDNFVKAATLLEAGNRGP